LERSIRTLSLRPNLHSGMPERYDLTITEPETSARRMAPWQEEEENDVRRKKKAEEEKRKERKGTLVGHQEVEGLDDINEAFVLPVLEPFLPPRDRTGGLDGDHLALLLQEKNKKLKNWKFEKLKNFKNEWDLTANLSTAMPPWVMYSFRVSTSLFWGYPKSMISDKRRRKKERKMSKSLFSSTRQKNPTHHQGARRPGRSCSWQHPHQTCQSRSCQCRPACTKTQRSTKK